MKALVSGNTIIWYLVKSFFWACQYYLKISYMAVYYNHTWHNTTNLVLGNTTLLLLKIVPWYLVKLLATWEYYFDTWQYYNATLPIVTWQFWFGTWQYNFGHCRYFDIWQYWFCTLGNTTLVFGNTTVTLGKTNWYLAYCYLAFCNYCICLYNIGIWQYHFDTWQYDFGILHTLKKLEIRVWGWLGKTTLVLGKILLWYLPILLWYLATQLWNLRKFGIGYTLILNNATLLIVTW